VTANLYLPKHLSKPAPAILYVCGHAYVITNGVSYGNKTAYHHHGAWFARNGYVCLILDTIQLGEIQGVHHGTYREGMWWWNARGYTPAGVEAWNGMRALDYLQSRPEVDGERLGVTGRSGGGAYSWWVTALDGRIKAAAPVAGITDLQNHVVDGTVEGHCDCMFFVNTYRWDFPMVAALAAPRPLLLCNSDKDSIFPLEGVERLHSKVSRIYKLYGATNNLGLLITEGEHKDTQDLQLPVFRWFNRHLKGEDPIIEMAATRFFTPQQLKVFDVLPPDERTSRIHETFVPVAPVPEAPRTPTDWAKQKNSWKAALQERVFAGWPDESRSPTLSVCSRETSKDGQTLSICEFNSQPDVRLRAYVLRSPGGHAARVRLLVQNEPSWREWLQSCRASFSSSLRDELGVANSVADAAPSNPARPLTDEVQICFAPRGIGLSSWDPSELKQRQIRRRFMLLGQTLDGMRVWDIRRAMGAIRAMDELQNLPLVVEAEGSMGVNALYASLFEPGVRELRLTHLLNSHRQGPDYLNVLRFLDIPQALAMAEEDTRIELIEPAAGDWTFPVAVASNLHWPPDRFRIASTDDGPPGLK
jgi:dienelactone hydrolase